jgi:HSP20 family protein
VNRLFEQAFGDAYTGEESEEMSSRSWTPAVDIAESDDRLTLFAELPGLAKDDVQITLEDNVLTVKGERRFERDETKESFHRIERAYGVFQRSFHLPSNVQADKVEAAFADGVLRIAIPKQEEAKPRKIEIS